MSDSDKSKIINKLFHNVKHLSGISNGITCIFHRNIGTISGSKSNVSLINGYKIVVGHRVHYHHKQVHRIISIIVSFISV